jgi:signal transduction histidine kinase
MLSFFLTICSLPFACCAQEPAPGDSRPAVTNAAQLRTLSFAEASSKVPVKLRATVTAFNMGRSVFLQDETGGTFINGIRPAYANLRPGDVVEVEGVTHSGLFVPGINAAKVKRVGRAELPAAVPVHFDDLLTGKHHYQRVEISGIVRSVVPSPNPTRVVITLACGPNTLELQLNSSAITNLPPLVDARVTVTGLAAGYINDRRQIIAPQLFLTRVRDIRVEVPPPANPFDAPLTAATALLNFDPAGISNHRVHVSGVVTHQQPGEAIFLRDAEHGLAVETTQDQTVRPGDVVEAIGFPAMGRFSAFLQNAEFRVVKRGLPPQPLPTTVTAVLHGTNDADLVTLDAQLLEVLETPAEKLLVLGAENTAFRARLPRTTLHLRNGSNLRLTGVCRVAEPEFSSERFGAIPGSIELLLRSPDDIAVIVAPSWWTAQRLAVATSVLLGLALAAFAWVVLLRRRVVEQSLVIREKIQREAALEERHRMAREMHDTLAQSFSGLGFQLEALKTKLPPDTDEVRRQLETARQMVRHGQESFRRSLMNLRAQELERGSLAEALPEIARQITAGTGIDVRCEVQRPATNLTEAVEMNLLRISQECLVNAVHHAKPARIELSLRQEPNGIQLCITDDGAGFEPEQLKHAPNGHFGWRGIHERADQIRAKVELDSHPGRGTKVTVTVPT